MTENTPSPRRVFAHNQETEPKNPERVEERARQLAAKDGRSADRVTDEDRSQAWQELQEEEGLGAPGPQTVEERARELAVIDGRSPDQVTDADREQARQDLQQTSRELPPEEPVHPTDAPRNPGEPPAQTGTQAARKKSPDEARFDETEAKEGVREADHDRRLKARQRPAEEQ